MCGCMLYRSGYVPAMYNSRKPCRTQERLHGHCIPVGGHRHHELQNLDAMLLGLLRPGTPFNATLQVLQSDPLCSLFLFDLYYLLIFHRAIRVCLSRVVMSLQSGEYCESCPPGGICDGGYAEPRALPGFYIGNISQETRSDACSRRHTTRTRYQPWSPYPLSYLGL